MRRAVVYAVLLATIGVTAGCGGGGGDDDAAAPRTEPSSALPPAWNPCSGLDAQQVGRIFGGTFATRLGTAEVPTCTFSPQADGDPVVDVNYQAYVGSLTELLATFGVVVGDEDTAVSTPTIPGADEARVIVDVDEGTIAVTGFVQNGRLVQIVNVLDPQPFDRKALRAGIESVMAALAANAGSSGLTG
ncbi:hypothetical protein [Nocardioides sp.]|uniref:hypothetical protein n=1 Tax=Nocardioides sp. TaxID=35761 RepID=UPI0027202B57|nr:hypothetical protein [Nocardioides sp.]MDO9456368.1 hypothetical protein [Nocardioides sp.]